MLAHFAHHLVTALPVPLLPLIRSEFNLGYVQAGLVVSAFSLSYGIGQLPAGWLADRVGPRLMITIGICGVALAGLFVGLSQTYIMMIIFLVLMGVVGGGYHPSAAPLISASVAPEYQGRALGFHLVGGGASFFLAPLIAAAVAAAWGWRGSFIALAVPTAIFGVILYILLGRRVGTTNTRSVVTDRHEEVPSSPGRWRRLVVFMLLGTATQAVTFAVIAFIPLFMVDHFGVAEEAAPAFVAIVYSAGLWASPLGGYLSDRLGSLPVVLVVSLLTGPVIYLLTLVPGGLGIGVLLLVFGVVMYLRMPVSEAYIIGQTPERRRSMILGIYYFSGMVAGGVLAPVMGSLIERFNYYTSFTIAAASLTAVTLISALFLWKNRD